MSDITITIGALSGIDKVFKSVNAKAAMMAASVNKSLGTMTGGVGAFAAASGRATNRVNAHVARMAARFKLFARSSMGSLKSVGGAMVVLARKASKLGALVGGVSAGLSIRTFAGFDAGMAAVSAKSGATGADLDRLREKAKELGASTAFSATEAAKGMELLGQAGFSTQQILAGIGPTLSLAAAGGTELGEAADIASDVASAFQLSADEIGRVADVIAKTSTSANTTVLMMGETFSKVAPSAAALGQRLEEVSAAAGLLGNSGIKASEAGTGLRNIFAQLATSPVQKELKRLGVSLKDDATGEFLPLMDIMRDFDEKTASMTGPEKLGKAVELFGKRSATSALILASAGDQIDVMRSKMNNAEGAAAEMAATMQDSLGGVGVKIKSAFEGMQIAMVETFEGPLTKIGESIVASLRGSTEWFNRNATSMKRIGVVIHTAFVAVARVVKALSSAMTGLLGSAFKSVTGGGNSMAKAIQIASEKMIRAITWFEVVLLEFPTTFSVVLNKTAEFGAAMADTFRHWFAVVIPRYFAWFGLVVVKILNELAANAPKLLLNMAKAVGNAITGVFRAAVSKISSLIGKLASVLADTMGKVASIDPTGLAAELEKELRHASQFANAMQADLVSRTKKNTDALTSNLVNLTAGFHKAITDLPQMPDIPERQITEAEKKFRAAAETGGANLAKAFADKIGDRLKSLNVGKSWWGLEEQFSPIISKLKGAFQGVFKGAVDSVNGVEVAAVIKKEEDGTVAALQAVQSRLLTRGRADDPNTAIRENTKRANALLKTIATNTKQQQKEPKPAVEFVQIA